MKKIRSRRKRKRLSKWLYDYNLKSYNFGGRYDYQYKNPKYKGI